MFFLRNKKRIPCFYRVIETQVEVWENEKCLGTRAAGECFHSFFDILKNELFENDDTNVDNFISLPKFNCLILSKFTSTIWNIHSLCVKRKLKHLYTKDH